MTRCLIGHTFCVLALDDLDRVIGCYGTFIDDEVPRTLATATAMSPDVIDWLYVHLASELVAAEHDLSTVTYVAQTTLPTLTA